MAIDNQKALDWLEEKARTTWERATRAPSEQDHVRREEDDGEWYTAAEMESKAVEYTERYMKLLAHTRTVQVQGLMLQQAQQDVAAMLARGKPR